MKKAWKKDSILVQFFLDFFQFSYSYILYIAEATKVREPKDLGVCVMVCVSVSWGVWVCVCIVLCVLCGVVCGVWCGFSS